MTIETKLTELNNLLKDDRCSLGPILNAAIQLTELHGDDDFRILFEYHLRGLEVTMSAALQTASPEAYQMFFTDRKKVNDSKSLTGSIASLEAHERSQERDVEDAAQEVKRVRAAQPMPPTLVTSSAVGVANSILSQYRQIHGQSTEILGRIRLRVASYVRDFETENLRAVSSRVNSDFEVNETNLRKVFLVHGHDNEIKQTVARFLENLGLSPVILHEQANQGRTLIEKFEHHSDVGFAVVLLTSDDSGSSKANPDNVKPRARQNVVFELGFFYGKLSRARVCAMLVPGVEKPSDIDGVVYIAINSAGAWKIDLAKELRAAGIEIDMNRL